MTKFMLSVHKDQYEKMKREADSVGITMQEFLRAVVIPFYYRYSSPLAGEIEKKIVEQAYLAPSIDLRKDREGRIRSS